MPDPFDRAGKGADHRKRALARVGSQQDRLPLLGWPCACDRRPMRSRPRGRSGYGSGCCPDVRAGGSL